MLAPRCERLGRKPWWRKAACLIVAEKQPRRIMRQMTWRGVPLVIHLLQMGPSLTAHSRWMQLGRSTDVYTSPVIQLPLIQVIWKSQLTGTSITCFLSCGMLREKKKTNCKETVREGKWDKVQGRGVIQLGNRERACDKSTLHVCVKISRWNPWFCRINMYQ